MNQTYHHIRVTDRGDQVATIDMVPPERTPRWAEGVAAGNRPWSPPTEEPVFHPPIAFVVPPPEGSGEPFYSHNHQPAITWCANGDLLAAWYSTERERGTEMTVLASRLRTGRQAWDPAAEFFKAPDRNMTGTALYHDGRGTLYHFNGMGLEGTEGWERLALLLRTSTDHGVTWSPARPISSGSRYQRRHQVIAGTSRGPDGLLIQPCDATPTGKGSSCVHLSTDGGQTWHDPGGDIRGIHAGVVALDDGRLLAFGRAQALDGRMPMSISDDRGASWRSLPGPFPPIGTAQRLVLLRLREGPLLLASFTGATHRLPREQWPGMPFQDARGRSFTGYGLFVACSWDAGQTWPLRRLLTPGAGTWDGGGHTGLFTGSATEAEPKGYLAATQPPNGVIHLISSRLHYRFNLPWLTGGGEHGGSDQR